MAENETSIEERDEILAIMELEFALIEQRQPDEEGLTWLPEWYLGRLGRIGDARKAVKQRYREMMDHMDAEERALDYRWGPQFKEEVDRALAQQGGKKKSVKFLTGQAGYRANKGSIEIADMQAAKVWAADNLPHARLVEAISGLNKTPLVEAVRWSESVDPDTGEVAKHPDNVPDGCILYPPGDKFYPAPPAKKYLPKQALNQLETEGESCE